ncbi:hypothetical protein ACP3A4_004659 [Serratia marcescens]
MIFSFFRLLSEFCNYFLIYLMPVAFFIEMILSQRNKVTFFFDIQPQFISDITDKLFPADETGGYGQPGAGKQRGAASFDIINVITNKQFYITVKHEAIPDIFILYWLINNYVFYELILLMELSR